MFEKPPALHISIDQTVNLGQYQSAKVSMSITNLPFDADEETIHIAMATQKLAFDFMKKSMRDKIAKVRQEGGFEADPETGEVITQDMFSHRK